jgi:DNA-binding GntR family transcriptional regulator
VSADAEPSLSAATGLTTALYARVKAEITALRLPPGAALQEAALGLRFSVSRTPVREVLQHLLRDGLVERHGRFYRVIQLTAPEVQALCEVREALECMALGLAFERDPGMRDDLQHLIAGQDAALGRDDFDLFSALYGQFHLRIAEGACNASLLQHFVMLQDKVALVRGMEQQRPFWRTRAVQDHNRIVDALARNTAEIAVGELRYHIRSVAGLRAAAWAAQRVAAV